MASTVRRKKEKEEFFDEPDVLDEKIERLADMVRASSHFIAFTGAGLSTSAGIPDFRSGMNTSVETGPGVWELKANQAQRNENVNKTVDMLQAIPTASHMSLLKLYEEGYLKFLISQNCDGLHRRSGFNPQQLAELHGNTNLEKCIVCKREYMRDFDVLDEKPDVLKKARKGLPYKRQIIDHITGRRCFHCSQDGRDEGRPTLIDSIIDFGEMLPEKDENEGFRQSDLADLCLVLGSSCTVTPACHMPENVGERGQNLVIVNLQKTPLESTATLNIYAKCDVVMIKLMEKLGLPIPEWKLARYVRITQSPCMKKRTAKRKEKSSFGLYIETFDHQDCVTPFESIVDLRCRTSEESELMFEENEVGTTPTKRLELGFRLKVSGKASFDAFERKEDDDDDDESKEKKEKEELDVNVDSEDLGSRDVLIDLEFVGHYEEPVATVPFRVYNDGQEHTVTYRIAFNPLTETEWNVTRV